MWNGTLKAGSQLGGTVLMDFDGVIFTNTRVTEHVIDRSVEWVSKTMDLSKKEALRLNRTTYKTQGHSSLIPNSNIEGGLLRSYNDFVFDDHFLDQILPNCVDEGDLSHMTNLVEIANSRGLRYALCTNAPKSYCDRILSLQGFAFSDVFREDFVFSSDITESVKPTKDFYNFVNNHLNDESTIHFLDDSAVNVVAANGYQNWCPILVRDRNDIYQHLAGFRMHEQR